MAFTYVTLQASGGYRDATGEFVTARIEATPLVPMLNESTITDRKVIIPLDSNGTALELIAATTDPGTTPAGNAYRIEVEVGGHNVRSFLAAIPHDAGQVVDLDDLAELVSPPSVESTKTGVLVDGVPVSLLAIDSTAVTAVDVGALPDTGGTVAGNITATGGSGTKALRLLTSGAGVNIDAGAENLLVRVFSTVGFGGTERQYLRFSKDAQEAQVGGELQVRDSIGGTTKHSLDPATGVAAVGAKNSLSPLRLCGLRATTGAPNSGTWTTGDLVLDSAGAWHLCTAGGTPGTWT